MSDLYTERYGLLAQNDLASLFLGEKLGAGTYRDVYALGIDKDLVVKIEARNDNEGNPHFCNVAEMDIWLHSRDHAWRKWLAPCLFISNYGAVLIQRRTQPCPLSKLPKKVPNFLADLKPENWGLYDGRPVVHDYGNHAVYHVARGAHKMVKGHWHDGLGKTLKLDTKHPKQ